MLIPAFFTQCETTELNLVNDPNTFAPEDAKPRFLLNTVQLSYIRTIEGLEEVGARLSRIKPMVMVEGDGTYLDFFLRDEDTNTGGDNFLGTAWREFYSTMLPNGNLLEINAAKSEANSNFHIAVNNILKAHIASILADYYGAIPFSQASRIFDYPNPGVDSGEVVYQECLRLLNDAITLLETNPTNSELDDLFYDGDNNNWIKFANSLKLRMYKNTGNSIDFNAIINKGDFISSTNEDMQFKYEKASFPKAPEFNSDYRGSSFSIHHKSNWLMNNMLQKNDPRIRYYFYRQFGSSYGVDIAGDASVLPCSVVTPPAHYTGFVYCAVGQGYNGRSHGHFGSERSATDLSSATLVGVYPFAGRFDDDRFNVVGGNIETGGKGLGIRPILLASDIDFWRGQMAPSTIDKATFLRAGMEKSIAKTQSFGSLDPDADLINFAPSSSDISTYIDNTINTFLSTTGIEQENIFAEQYFISMFGNGIEAYNYYRKTGYPTSLAPAWNPNPGAFPRSIIYPFDERTNNATIKALDRQLTDQVFWDKNPSSPTFPIAN